MASALAGGIASAQANRAAQKELEERERRNKEWYDMEMAKDYTQRADVMNLLNKQRQAYIDRAKSLAGTQAVAGGTEAAVAAEKERMNNAIAQTTADVAAQQQQRKDLVEQQYQGQADQISMQREELQRDKAKNIAEAASSAIGAGASIATNMPTKMPGEQQNEEQKKTI